jgi:hypothetical protein
MGMTDTILADHEQRKHDGISWFTAEDLNRLGIREPLMTAMQNVQHTLRLRRSTHVVETAGCVDRFSVRDAD